MVSKPTRHPTRAPAIAPPAKPIRPPSRPIKLPKIIPSTAPTQPRSPPCFTVTDPWLSLVITARDDHAGSAQSSKQSRFFLCFVYPVEYRKEHANHLRIQLYPNV